VSSKHQRILSDPTRVSKDYKLRKSLKQKQSLIENCIARVAESEDYGMYS